MSDNCTTKRAVDERTFVCIEEAPSLWPPGTVCQRGARAWAQSNASSWHCAYDTSNSLNYVQLTVMHVLICLGFCMFSCVWFVYRAASVSPDVCRAVMNVMLPVQVPFGLLVHKTPFLLANVLLHIEMV